MDIRRGIIRAFDSGTYLADVQIVGSMATVLTGVPVAKQIGAGLLTSGAKCGVLFFDETNPSDACVVFVYEGAPVAWVTSALIKDGEVAVADLAFDPATQVELDAHAALPSVHHGHASARAAAASSLALTTSSQDVPGCSLSLGAGTWLIFGVFDMEGDSTAVGLGVLDVGGADQNTYAEFQPSSGHVSKATVAQVWRITLASTTTVKLQAHKTAAVGTYKCYHPHTTITAIRTGE